MVGFFALALVLQGSKSARIGEAEPEIQRQLKLLSAFASEYRSGGIYDRGRADGKGIVIDAYMLSDHSTPITMAKQLATAFVDRIDLVGYTAKGRRKLTGLKAVRALLGRSTEETEPQLTILGILPPSPGEKLSDVFDCIVRYKTRTGFTEYEDLWHVDNEGAWSLLRSER